MRQEQDQWSPRKRASFWVKFIGMVAGTIIACAGAARVLGIGLDIQTKTEAKEQHEAIRREMKEDQAATYGRIDGKFNDINRRLDDLMSAMIARSKRGRND